MKPLNPFSFWPNYASAIRGFGGSDSGPDPSYCFHTLYQEFKPGSVTFHVHLRNANASNGELELRVNGYRPDSGMDAILVAGARLSLEDVHGDLEVPLRVAVLPGVSYAIFCRYTEPSDLTVESIEVAAEESDDDDADTYSSDLLEQTQFGTVDLDTPSHLLALEEPLIDFPRSQPFTLSQLKDGAFWNDAPACITSVQDPLDRWRHAFAFQALQVYGFAKHGSCGLLLTDNLPELATLVTEHGCLVVTQGEERLPGPFDFVIGHMQPREDQKAIDLTHDMLRGMKAVRRGGMGIFLLEHDASDIGFGRDDQNSSLPGRQSLQQIALRMIGHGCEVAQLSFPNQRRSRAVLDGPLPFGFIVQR